VSYCTYSSTARGLNKNGIYCLSSGAGYCNNDVIVFSAGKLVFAGGAVLDGTACPSYPVKYDSTNKRLIKSTEAYTCYGYVV
jgi:hypothetical protein